MKNKKDCSLVVQLLKCNQSLDRKFVSQKMYTVGNIFSVENLDVKSCYFQHAFSTCNEQCSTNLAGKSSIPLIYFIPIL